MIPPLAIVAGCAVGAGLALLIAELVRPQPALGPALRRLAAAPAAPEAEPAASRDDRWGAWLVEHLEGMPGVRIPTKNLALLGQSADRFLLTKVALAALGLLLPVVVMIPVWIGGLHLPFYLPTVFALAAAGLLWIVPDLAVRDQAKRAREEFAHAIEAYLDLVALKRIGDAGPAQALEEAAAVGRGWAFVRLQDAMVGARVHKVPPWAALAELTDELDLPVLEDVADIMRMSATDGASVYTTLRGRAEKLRSELLTAQATEANANSEKMTAPGALLAVLVMLLIAFPAVIRILTT